MKILLINPPNEHVIKYSSAWTIAIEDIGNFPPLGLMYISAVLREKTSHEVKIIDAVLEKLSFSDIETRIREFQPHIVGISSFSFIFYDVLETAKVVKKVNSNIHVSLGGPHVLLFPDETIAHSEIDSLVQGEGEYAFLELVSALEDNQDFSKIKGVIFKKDGEIIKTKNPGFIDNLDNLPFPAYDLVPFRKYFSLIGVADTVATIASSRGCPYRCTYCLSPRRPYRMRSSQNIVKEIKMYYGLGIRDFFFFDDTFNINAQRVIDVSNEILSAGLKVTWTFRGRIDCISEKMLALAKESGCRQIIYGVEDATDEGLRIICKGFTTKDVIEAVRLTKKIGIECSTNWIIGFPHHKTEKDITELVDFVIKLNPDYAEFSMLVPMPGTEIYEQGINKSVLNSSSWSDYIKNPTAYFLIDVWDEYFTREQLSRLYKRCHERFYFRPSYIIRSLIKIKNISELKRKAKAALTIAGLRRC